MKISTILDHIDSGHMALPEFQRGYVWNRDQVRGLMDSLYRKHPVGSLLVWATQSDTAQARGDGKLSAGVVKLLLDGQQRMTSLYGIVRGKPPAFFDGNAQSFTGLHFHLRREEFAFYSPVNMADDPLWIDVSKLMGQGMSGLGNYVSKLATNPDLAPVLGDFTGRLTRILGINDIELHIEEVTGADKTIDVVVDIFNRVNSGGTKLSQGDLALAKICADWPEARDRMKQSLRKWRDADYHFSLDWMLRCMNTIITREAKFTHLHDVSADQVADGLKRAERGIDYLLNIIGDRLGLDHDRVLFSRYSMPVLVHYLDRRGGHLDDAEERDRLLFWYLHSALWGRFSSAVESSIDQGLEALETLDGGLDRLIEELRLWHGGSLHIEPAHFGGWSLGARFYPMLYLLTRVGEARDWGSGVALKSHLLGKMSKLEVHHIFPKKILYDRNHRKPDVNAVANFCFLTKDTNLQISARPPEAYFPEIEEKHPGALASQWIPMDPELWRIERYLDFLQARRVLLAEAANAFLSELAHRPTSDDVQVAATAIPSVSPRAEVAIPGGVDSEEEEERLLALNEWVATQGLPEGEYLHELVDPDNGAPLAILDIAWPNGLQPGFSVPVAVLLDESREVTDAANAQGFRYFTTVEAFRHHVTSEVLAETAPAQAVGAD